LVIRCVFFSFRFSLVLGLSEYVRPNAWVSFCCRCVGVIGGVFVCMGYAIRITSRAVDVVSGADQTQGTIAAEATGVRAAGLRSKFTGSQLHSRKTSLGRVVRQGNGWVVENPSGPPAFGSPASGSFTPSGRPASHHGGSPYSPYAPSPTLAPPIINGLGSAPGSPSLAPPPLAPPPPPPSAPIVGLGINSPSFGPAPSAFPTAATVGSPYAPTSPGMTPPPLRSPSSGYAHFPPTPTGNGVGFAPPPPPVDRIRKVSGKKDE
jgi:hypothetical protein